MLVPSYHCATSDNFSRLAVGECVSCVSCVSAYRSAFVAYLVIAAPGGPIFGIIFAVLLELRQAILCTQEDSWWSIHSVYGVVKLR